jgi:hypothetical protein
VPLSNLDGDGVIERDLGLAVVNLPARVIVEAQTARSTIEDEFG